MINYIIYYILILNYMSDYKFSSILDDKKEEKNISDENLEESKVNNENVEKDKKEKIKRTISDKNAPYDNASVWAAWFFFGPVAWGILSYISLRNLWYEYAKYVLIWSILISFITSYVLIFIIPETQQIQIWILWLIFMLFQQKQVKKWANNNPDKKYKSWVKALWWWVVWLALFFIISFLTILTFSASSSLIESNISINKEYPNQVSMWDTFDIEFSINNISEIEHKLTTIDIDKDFLNGILILNSTPTFSNNYEEFWMQIYEFRKSLPIKSDNKIIFSAKAIKKGDFSWDVDFCIDDDITCIYSWMRIIVD